MIWLAGLPVIWWVAILLADAIQPGRNLFELMEVLTEKLNHPFQFHYTEYTIKSMLVCTLLYAAGIGIFYSSQKNYRRGEEHGSARWGDARQICKKYSNVNTKSRIIDYDIRELGEQLMPLGMLVTLDSIFNRVIQNWKKGKTTWIFADEFYLLFRYEYSADFFYRLYKRIRKYSGFVTGLTQNVEELLKSDTARLMLANSEFLILLNQATTDRDELAALLNISDNQLSYITNVGAGHGLIRCSGNLVPFENSFPRNTKLYRLMTTKPGEA